MKKTVRFTATILMLLVLILSLSACKEKRAEAYIDGVHLSEYTIVYSPEENDYDKRAAEYIAAKIEERTGISLSVVTDEGQINPHEIVVGDTERPISEKLDAECEGLEFAILSDGGHIALEGDHFIIAAAAYYFIDTYVTGREFNAELPKEAAVCEPIVREAKNFILLIGDGMGVNHTLLFDEMENGFEYGDGEDIFYGYLLPYHGYSRTQSLSGVTDSAAGGTALSSGFKTYNEYIGRDKDGNDVKLITELAAEKGLATAVMSTENRTGATPATFSAHAVDRDSDEEILESQTATRRDYGTIIDCGFDYYNKRMVNNSLEKHLTDTLGAISEEEDGFFLMYEEAHIDKHSHNNDLDKVFSAVVRFNQAIGRVMEFAFYNPETFVLITADHETGALRPDENGDPAFNSEEHTLEDVPVFAYGDGGELFDGVTVENIQIAHTLASFLGEYDFGDQSEFSYLGKE